MVRYDALIRRNWRYFADGIVDVGADPRLGAPGAERNAVYFSAQDFTHLTDAGYAIVGKDAAQAVLAPSAKLAPLRTPRLTFQNRAVQSKLGTAYDDALENLLRINTVPDLAHAHDASGLLTGDPALSSSAQAAATTSPGPATLPSIAGTRPRFWSRRPPATRFGPSASAVPTGR